VIYLTFPDVDHKQDSVQHQNKEKIELFSQLFEFRSLLILYSHPSPGYFDTSISAEWGHASL